MTRSNQNVRLPDSPATSAIDTAIARQDGEDAGCGRGPPTMSQTREDGIPPFRARRHGDTMMPEAFEHGGKLVGIVTTFGFALAFAISALE
jgi:hypothetical protein